MKVIAKRVEDKPADVKTSNWIKKDQTYTVIQSVKDRNGVEMYKLEELTPDFPYTGYAASRFEPVDGMSNKDLQAYLDEVIETEETVEVKKTIRL